MTYEMLTGRLPFSGDTQGALLVKQVSEPVPDVREVDPLIPESVAQWVATMTEKDPDDRFDDAGAAWDAFEEAVLEFIGPLWRRDATLEPASAIDLSSTPRAGRQAAGPQAVVRADRDDRLPDLPGAGGAARAARGRPDAAPAVVTPPPRPAAKPAARRTTAAPVAVPPTAAGPPATAKTASEDEPEPSRAARCPSASSPRRRSSSRSWRSSSGMSSKKSDPPATANGDGFVLKAPPGWKPAAAGIDPRRSARRARALAPPGAPAGEGIAAARLPTAQYAALASRGEVVARQARRRRGRAHRVDGDATLFVLPTDAGLVVVGCSGVARRARGVPRGRRVARADGRQGASRPARRRRARAR